ncbi:MAG: CoA pyrophosphatase [Myxococcales bacterium FL481]|nr:MAG: CoA pyrophosphatase [Myxococcales bacterium FL481]
MPFGAGNIALERLADALEPLDAELEPHAPLRPAAVLAVLLGGPPLTGSSRLLLIERANAGRHHAGQIALPGGKPEASDQDLLATALREAHEEVFVPRDELTVLGRLDPVPVPSGYFVVPFVAGETRGWQPSAFNHEVARLVLPTLDQLADPAVHQRHGERTWRGKTYGLHRYAISDPPLWGATARMVWDLMERLRRSA